MSYNDEVLLQSLLLLDGATGDEERAAAAYEVAWKATRGRRGVDAIHVAQWFARALLPVLQQNPDWRAILDRQIEEARLFAQVDLPPDEPDLERDRGRG